MTTKRYALVNGNHVRYAELRETPKFLINDNTTGYKFKKVDNQDHIASNRRFTNWSHTGYDVYEVDHPYVLKVIQHEKEKYFVFNVRQKLEKLHMERSMPFEKAKKINELLELGVDL